MAENKNVRRAALDILMRMEKEEGEGFFENMTIEEHVQFYEKQGLRKMDAIKACAKDRGLPKNEVYKHFI
jgi:16S rRNA (cytidine1402-2'-O)-methyltransferase